MASRNENQSTAFLQAGIIGIALGVIGSAALYAFANKNQRQKMEKAIDDIKAKAIETLDELKCKTKNLLMTREESSKIRPKDYT